MVQHNLLALGRSLEVVEVVHKVGQHTLVEEPLEHNLVQAGMKVARASKAWEQVGVVRKLVLHRDPLLAVGKVGHMELLMVVVVVEGPLVLLVLKSLNDLS